MINLVYEASQKLKMDMVFIHFNLPEDPENRLRDQLSPKLFPAVLVLGKRRTSIMKKSS